MVFRKSISIIKTEDPQRSIMSSSKVNQLVITRQPKMCNFLDYKDYKIVYKRYASLYFITIVDKDQNELIVLELMQSFVEILDKYFGNVCELDLIFNFHKVQLAVFRLILFWMNWWLRVILLRVQRLWWISSCRSIRTSSTRRNRRDQRNDILSL